MLRQRLLSPHLLAGPGGHRFSESDMTCKTPRQPFDKAQETVWRAEHSTVPVATSSAAYRLVSPLRR